MTAAERFEKGLHLKLEHRYFEASGLRLHCAVAGSGPPLVLVHGLNIGWGEWYAVLARFAERYSVYAIDLPGAGDSAKIDFLTADIAALFTEAVDAAIRVFAPTGAVVVGHSLGAWAVLKLAAKNHPGIRSVVAVSPVGFTDVIPRRFLPLAIKPLAKLIAATAMKPNRDTMTSFLKGVMVDGSGLISEYVEYLVEHITRPPLTHPFLLIHRLFRPFKFRDAYVFSGAELKGIAVPVDIVHGAQDPLIPLAEVRNNFGLIRNGRVSILDGSGHVPLIEQPEAFMEIFNSIAATS